MSIEKIMLLKDLMRQQLQPLLDVDDRQNFRQTSSICRDTIEYIPNIRFYNIFRNAWADLDPLNGSVSVGGDPNLGGDACLVEQYLNRVKSIKATFGAFAALRKDGRIFAWGHSKFGGDAMQVQQQLHAIKNITSTLGAFAALREDGRVFAWGHSLSGGDATQVQHKLTAIQQVIAIENAFIAIREDGEHISW